MELGVIISGEGTPSPSRIDFVAFSRVNQGQFVEIPYEEGTLLALVTDVVRANRYYVHPDVVKEYERSGGMRESFPVELGELLVASARPLVVWREGRPERPTFPPPPGSKVLEPSADHLFRFLGFDGKGLHIGKLAYHNVDVKINMGKLVQKHFAILAMSGAGKSYLTSVILEELLDRPKDAGRIGVVVFDVHGEYVGFAEDPYGDRTTVYPADQIKLGLPQLSAEALAEFLPGLSQAGIRDLHRVIGELRERMNKGEGPYGMEELIKAVEADRRMKENTKSALVAWLERLKATNLFAPLEHPPAQILSRPGRLSIIDLSPLIDLNRKQLIVAYFARRLFALRREGQIPPTLLVVEEAHQFIPDARKEVALSRNILETIAREGRKFGIGLCLISQRPIKLSATALSQCNTHIILRMTNPYDLDHVKQSSEGIDAQTAKMITSLRPGEAIIVGAAVNFPVFVKVRKRKSKESKFEKTLEEMALEFEQKEEQVSEDLSVL